MQSILAEFKKVDLQKQIDLPSGIMIEVNVEEAATNLLGLLEQVATGEDVMIFKSGKPIAKIVSVEQRPRFGFGEDVGKGWIADDFDAPLPDDLQAYFEGRGE